MNKKHLQIGAGAIAAIVIIVIVCFSLSRHANDQPMTSNPSNAVSKQTDASGRTSTDPASSNGSASGNYAFSEAPDHIGEKAAVTGTVVRVFTSKSGATFLDYCPGAGSCPFSAVIFASDAAAFGDLTKYQAKISVTGIIRSYQGNAEMVLNDPSQILVY